MTAFPYIHSVGQRFAAVAAAAPARPALAFSDGRVLRYGDLAALSGQVAALLHHHGVRRDDAVALLLEKSPAAYAAMLGALHLGAPYVNLDRTSPAVRLARILDRCRPRVLLVDAAPEPDLAVAARDLGIVILGPDVAGMAAAAPPLPADRATPTGTTPAYLMFTSGSTGFPKGAVIPHAALLNLAAWAAETFALTPDDRLTNVNPLYFDNAVFDVYASLLTGACLHPFTRDETAEARALVKAVGAAGCTVWFSVPSMLMMLTTLRAIAPGDLAALRLVIFGGEGYPKPELRKLYDLLGGHARLVNVYGPTECTCICSAHAIGPADFSDGTGLATLGRLAPNFEPLILDGDRPVAPGETGELCLRGPQVGLGYWRDPARTAAAFVPNPLHDRYPETIYRTGDLVRADADGRLWFRGRADNQIKHMGYRIELEEVDAALYAVAGVREAAAAYVRTRAAWGHIVAAVSGEPGLAEAGVVAALRARLPPYMVPDRVRVLEHLPKNRNGKISRPDVRALFLPDAAGVAPTAAPEENAG
ncbi:amino acid adenylation domain-containing protein [Roseospira goensis]|uniref:D-alanine--poly(Phosphoribitol) ligase subunit 1 n=1 Tax=Roseospira goensis TaxID=391922 RepID=A0A7W6RWN1_9PROT|nr:amino acid adenylation domain-containing protein [Roseospira goensis]MBB4284613.1 D-alanine--poly(phosphoribitol) ligase subunit 1 [Roseospira goensis]